MVLSYCQVVYGKYIGVELLFSAGVQAATERLSKESLADLVKLLKILPWHTKQSRYSFAARKM